MPRKQDLPLHEVRRLLEPGPVVLVTTSHAGEQDVMRAAARPRHPETLHYKGDGTFMVSGKVIRRQREGLKQGGAALPPTRSGDTSTAVSWPCVSALDAWAA